MSIKVALILVAIAVVIAGLGRLEYLSKKNSEIKSQLAATRSALESSVVAAEKQRADLVKANKQLAEYLATIREIENENQSYADCIAAGTCGVRIVRANCPSVPKTTADAAGAEPGTPILDAGLQQDILNLRSGIMRLEADFTHCQKTLRSWAQLTGN